MVNEIYNLIADKQKIIERVKNLYSQDQTQLALQVLDLLLQQEPDDIIARKLHIELLENLAANDDCLMSRNAWIYYRNRDKEFLKSQGQ